MKQALHEASIEIDVFLMIPTTGDAIATFGTLAGLLILERLPRLSQPVLEIDGFERCTIDRFWLVLEVRNSEVAVEGVARDMVRLQPLRIVVLEAPS